MKNFDFGVYGNILAVKQAHLFDIGCFLMRIYMYMGTLGVVSMLTLSGHSAFFSGTVSSTLAISTFFIAPRTGKFMDEKGRNPAFDDGRIRTSIRHYVCCGVSDGLCSQRAGNRAHPLDVSY